MQEIYLTSINAFLYAMLFLYSYKKCKNKSHVLLISFIWFISSIFSIFYVQSDIKWESIHETTFLPFIYLFGVFILTYWPLLIVQSKKLVIDESKFINKVCLFISIIAFIPFIENVIKIFLSGFSMADLAENYENRGDINFDLRSHMSFVGSKLNSVLIFMQHITPILLFNYLSQKREKKLIIIIGLICAILNIALFSFNLGSRGVTFNLLLYVCFIFLLYKDHLSKKYLKIITITGSLLSGILILCLVYITISRFGNTQYTLLDWVYRYAGESFVNFNNDLFYISNYTNGENTFPFIFNNGQRNIYELSKITGVRAYVYYTYIGDFYMDFGPYITIILVSFLSILFYRFLKKREKLNLGSIIIYSLYSMIMLLSTNCFYFINRGIIYGTFTLIVGIWYCLKIEKK